MAYFPLCRTQNNISWCEILNLSIHSIWLEHSPVFLCAVPGWLQNWVAAVETAWPGKPEILAVCTLQGKPPSSGGTALCSQWALHPLLWVPTLPWDAQGVPELQCCFLNSASIFLKPEVSGQPFRGPAAHFHQLLSLCMVGSKLCLSLSWLFPPS